MITPGKWTAASGTIYSDKDEEIARCNKGRVISSEAIDNASHIAHVVNSFDDLLAAAGMAYESLQTANNIPQSMRELRAAIAKAKGE
jgi:hypothetical protein